MLWIEGLDPLTSLDGLPLALPVAVVKIRNNPLLPQADAEAWIEASAPNDASSSACGNMDGPPCGSCGV